jgi:adenylate cyclase class IV/GNAT superfamily N-acetyltransferase
MARNVEIKAHVADIASLSRAVAAAADQGPIDILQDDTFFRCPDGRLKLRTFSPTSGELIFYRRPDAAGPKVSSYLLSATSTPHTLREALSQAWGVVGRVRKRRTLYLVGRTRVHLDDVEGLGHFVEIEVVLADGESEQAGIAEADALMARLGVSATQLVEAAYVDLLAAARLPADAIVFEPDAPAGASLNAFLDDRICAFNIECTGFADGRPFAAVRKSPAGDIVAAANGHTWGGCCFIAHLWVHPALRRQGTGSALLREVEQEALRRGCVQSLLLTHSFQAPVFCERLGYTLAAEIAGYPQGHAQHAYAKRLTHPTASPG